MRLLCAFTSSSAQTSHLRFGQSSKHKIPRIPSFQPDADLTGDPKQHPAELNVHCYSRHLPKT